MAKRTKTKRKARARGTSRHPGVILRPRSRPGGAEIWLARWRDPITEKFVEMSLSAQKVTNEYGRRTWAVAKAKELAQERQALAAGRIDREGPREIKKAIEAYLTGGHARLRERTIECYRSSLGLLEEFAAEVGMTDMHALTPPLLHRLRVWIIGRPRRRSRDGGIRGETLATGDPRSTAAINRDLRHLKAFLNQARRQGIAPRLDAEVVKENLKAVRGNQDRPEFLRPDQLKALLEAALRHDQDTFVMTRDEKANGESGTVPRHPPIAPLVLTALLTGCRINELLTLPWSSVLFDGRGEILIAATISKTHRARAIDLGVCPSLLQLLRRMKLTAGENDFVFGGADPLPRGIIEAARKRLRKTYAAPPFAWQVLRSTCATYSTNAGALFGTASAYQSAKRLGHSVVVSERNYAGLLSDLPIDAKTLEAVMQIKDLAETIANEGRLGATTPSSNQPPVSPSASPPEGSPLPRAS